jgi:hypothetical protein
VTAAEGWGDVRVDCGAISDREFEFGARELDPEFELGLRESGLAPPDDILAGLVELARGGPPGWDSTVAVRVVRIALVLPSTVTVSGRLPRRGLGCQTWS